MNRNNYCPVGDDSYILHAHTRYSNEFADTLFCFLFVGAVGDWTNYFTDEQNEALDFICREKLAGTGLQFKFD